MAIEKVRAHLEKFGCAQGIMEKEVSSATVELAALAVGVEAARIAKTLSFYAGDAGALLVVCAGDTKIDNAKFKAQFGMKAKMLRGEDVERLTGHAPGGVCPFANPEGTQVYLDTSLRRFSSVFPACGSSNSMIELTCEALEEYTGAQGWVEVCKAWENEK